MAEETDTAVEDAVEELYGLPRDDFVTRRDELVRAARSAGDRDGAARIAKLRKPSVAAWLANALAREHPDEVGALEELGASLRAAQDRLEGDALRRLSRRRHELVAALVDRGRRIARDDGVRISDSVVRDLERTVTAALADPDAARALAGGRLVTALEPGAGLGSATASTSRTPARPGRPRRPSSGATAGPEPTAGPGPDDPATAASTARAERERAAAQAEQAERAQQAEQAERAERRRAAEQARRERAERELADADAAVVEATALVEGAATAVADAATEVTEQRARLAVAEEADRRARDDAAEAERVLAARRRDLDDARERLARHDGGPTAD